MGKIKRLLDRFDEMGRYPIQELGYSRTWLMFSYLGAFLVHRCTIADYFLYHFYERNRRGRAEFVTLYDMRDIHRKNPQTAFADFEEKDRFLDRFQAYVHRDWIGRVCRNSREEFDAFADRHPRCIIKPRTDSGGHGVELCTITPNNRDQVWERLTSQDMIAEELLEQCPEMAALHPSSVNNDVPICFMVTRLIPSSIHPVVVREGGMSADMGITLMFCLVGIMLIGFALYRFRFRQVRLTERVEALKEQLED